jgi:hypothetical protein
MNKREFEITVPVTITVVYDADKITCKDYQDYVLASFKWGQSEIRSILRPYLGPLTVSMIKWDLKIDTTKYSAHDVGVVEGK